MTTATQTAHGTGPMGWLRRAEAWLDDKGTGAWIAAMVLGFVFFWPVGLALVLYITFTNRWSKKMFKGSCGQRRQRRAHHHVNTRSSGNSAFDSYKEETLRRLEEEQDQFEAFLERLRAAKDKSEFDAFMDERAFHAASDGDDGSSDDRGDKAPA